MTPHHRQSIGEQRAATGERQAAGGARMALVTKEVRALAFPWIACLATMIGSAIIDRGAYIRVGILAYFTGVAGLGALSIGHEYLNRTLPSLLALPVSRRRLLAVKLGVLGLMLAVVTRVAAATIFAGRLPVGDLNSGFVRVAVLVVPPLSALLLAPWLTMACRSPVAGAIFSMSMPGVSLTAGTLAGVLLFGLSADIDDFRATFFVWTMPILLVAGMMMTWRTFMRLEAVEGRGKDLRLPAWLTRSGDGHAPRRNRSQWWLLIQKELHLYQMAYAFAGLEVLGYAVAKALTGSLPHTIEVFWVLTFFYGLMVPLLIGTHASAEERHLGTREWQALLPMATSTQWMVKVATAMAVALALAIGLPALLAWIDPWRQPLFPLRVAWVGVALAIGLTAAGLYVSSLSTTGVRAVLAAWPAVFVAGWFVNFLTGALGREAWDALSRLLGLPVPLDSPVNRIDGRLLDGVGLALAAAVLLLLLRLALTNHRAADRSPRRIASQTLWIAAALALSVVVVGRL